MDVLSHRAINAGHTAKIQPEKRFEVRSSQPGSRIACGEGPRVRDVPAPHQQDEMEIEIQLVYHDNNAALGPDKFRVHIGASPRGEFGGGRQEMSTITRKHRILDASGNLA